MYFLLRAQVHTIVKIQLEIRELLIVLKIYFHLSVAVLPRLLESQVIGKVSGVLLGKIYWFFVIQLMKWRRFTVLSSSVWLNSRAWCAGGSVWRYSLCAAQLPWVAFPSTICRKFPSLLLLSAPLLTEMVIIWGIARRGLKAALGEGACFPGLRLLGQAAAASFGLILTVPKCWSSLCRAGEDFLSRGHFLGVPEGADSCVLRLRVHRVTWQQRCMLQ